MDSSSSSDQEADLPASASSSAHAAKAAQFVIDTVVDEFLEESDDDDEQPPPLKRRRKYEPALIQAWVRVKAAGAHKVHLSEVSGKFWTTVEVAPLVPTRNPFVELQATFSVDPEYALVSIDGARAVDRVAAKDFNLAAAAAGLKHRVRGKAKSWTRASGEAVKPSDAEHAPAFRVLCRPAAYFRVLLEFGEEFADQLSDPQAEALAKNVLRPFEVQELPPHLKFSQKPRSLPAADWAPIAAVMAAYLERGQVSGFAATAAGLVDADGDLVLATAHWPLFKQCADRVELEAVSAACGGAEQMADSELRRQLQRLAPGEKLRLRGNPARRLVDPTHKETYTGFAYLCRLACAEAAPWPDADWHSDIHRALTDPLARSLLGAIQNVLRVDRTAHTWQSINQLLDLKAPPAANKLILCASLGALAEVERMVTSAAKPGRPANIASFTSCFCGPKKEVFMILDDAVPRELVVASLGLATEKITVLFEPGTKRAGSLF